MSHWCKTDLKVYTRFWGPGRFIADVNSKSKKYTGAAASSGTELKIMFLYSPVDSEKWRRRGVRRVTVSSVSTHCHSRCTTGTNFRYRIVLERHELRVVYIGQSGGLPD